MNSSAQNISTSPKSAANWAHQTIGLFPPSKMVTPDYLRGLVNLLCNYPEMTLAQALDTTKLVAAHQYLPDLHTFKKILDDVQSIPAQEAQRQKRLAQQIKDRAMYQPKEKSIEWFTGPIENIRPGDKLPPSRIEEYNEYMRKTHGFTPKHWTATEEWKDTGQRPFAQRAQQKPNSDVNKADAVQERGASGKTEGPAQEPRP